jgi:chromate transporter
MAGPARATRPICPMRSTIPTPASRLREVGLLFLRLGLLGFGGPAAHIALMREEVVRRRGWLSEEEFLDLVGAVNLLPGPNSTELAIHIGLRRAGLAGLCVAGAAFILPAMLLVLGAAWVYVRFGHLPAVLAGWNGAKPAVVAVVALAVLAFARTAVRPRGAWPAAGVALALALAGVAELPTLLAGGAVAFLVYQVYQAGSRTVAGVVGLDWLLWYFLKVGSVLYGSGYVLLSFLRGGLVERAHLLTESQLLDAIAVGQITPGPVFTTATFVGYLLRGVPGAVVATVGIFLPAFVLVGAGRPLVDWLRRTPGARAFLDGVNAAAVALMGLVVVQLGRSAVTSVPSVAVLAASLLLLRAGVNSAWLVAGGAVAGLLVH